MGWLAVPRDWLASFGEITEFCGKIVVLVFTLLFAFNYVFTQTLLATHPDISIIK